MVTAVSEFYKEMEGLFEGKIKCPSCAQLDWKQFIYLRVDEGIKAVCKRCGQIQEVTHDNRGD